MKTAHRCLKQLPGWRILLRAEALCALLQPARRSHPRRFRSPCLAGLGPRLVRLAGMDRPAEQPGLRSQKHETGTEFEQHSWPSPTSSKGRRASPNPIALLNDDNDDSDDPILSPVLRRLLWDAADPYLNSKIKTCNQTTIISCPSPSKNSSTAGTDLPVFRPTSAGPVKLFSFHSSCLA